MLRTLALAVAAAGLAGCWTTETRVDVAADAAAPAGAINDGTYCLVDETEDYLVRREMCAEIAWDAERALYVIDNWALFDIGTHEARLAALEPPYLALQILDPDPEADPAASVAVAVLQVQADAIFVLPRPSAEAYAALAADVDGLAAVAGEDGGAEITAGTPAQVRAFLSATARRWAKENHARPDPLYFPGPAERDRALMLLKVDEVHVREQAQDAITYAELGFQMDVYGGRKY
jgi:hypothetical protein